MEPYQHPACLRLHLSRINRRPRLHKQCRELRRKAGNRHHQDCRLDFRPPSPTEQAREAVQEETRELAEGDRISFTTANRENRVRSGNFATVERIGEDNSISARLDSGRAVELDPEKARHIATALADAAFSGSSIQSAVRAGVVKLYGNVRTNDEKTFAEAKMTICAASRASTIY